MSYRLMDQLAEVPVLETPGAIFILGKESTTMQMIQSHKPPGGSHERRQWQHQFAVVNPTRLYI